MCIQYQISGHAANCWCWLPGMKHAMGHRQCASCHGACKILNQQTLYKAQPLALSLKLNLIIGEVLIHGRALQRLQGALADIQAVTKLQNLASVSIERRSSCGQ